MAVVLWVWSWAVKHTTVESMLHLRRIYADAFRGLRQYDKGLRQYANIIRILTPDKSDFACMNSTVDVSKHNKNG